MPTQQISGTIYQMYDASGNNRRFPVTVVDGVLGLRSYMEDQFSSLANLYMGINDVALSGTVLTVKGVSVNLATITDLSNYYTKNEADGRFLGISANAVSATKLQTARTIWGQNFDGTANVTGAMSGVTNINSVINIDNGYVGIGKTPAVALDVDGQIKGTQLLSTVTSAAPLVVNSTTQVDNLTSQYATNPKSETKTGQEFVFRKTNVEWDAKSGVIKKIKGKTLAWNQLGRTSASSGIYGGITLVANADGSFSVSGTAQETQYFDFYDSRDDGAIISGHKYYIGCGLTGGTGETYCIYDRGTFAYISDGRGVILTGAGDIFVPAFRISSSVSVDFNVYPQLIDLTLLYGSAIYGLTDAEILAKFESEYPGYHDYSAGKLISNDAKQLETVGRNIWDEEWRNGYYNETTGVYEPSSSQYICTKNPVRIIGGATYYLRCPGARIYISYYSSSGALINTTTWSVVYDGNTFTPPANANKMNFWVVSSYGATYNHDICVNLSNPVINGQYFPYKKSRINLGLKNIKVVSPNVWDEEAEAGYFYESGGNIYYSGEDSSSTIRSKNFIPVCPDTDYYRHTGTGIIIRVAYFDADKNFISLDSYGLADTNFHTPANAAFIKFHTDSYGMPYNGGITINLSNPAFNGRYFPYGTLNLEGGLRSGSNYDGTYKACDYILDNKLHRKFGVKNGDSLTLHNTSTANFKTYKVILTDGTVVGATAQNQVNSFGIIYNGPLNSETVDYETIQYNGESDKTYYISFNPERNVEDFKLYYELQYEEVYDLAEPLPSVYPCDQFGTERVISPVSTTPSAPFCADIQYGAKSDDVANDLIGVRDAVQPLLDALQYDGQNHAWHLKGNLYAEGFITAYGINGGARTAVIAPYVIESSNYSTSKIWVGLNVMNEAIAKYKQGYLVQAKKAGEYITYSVTSIDESSYILYCNGGSVTVELES